LEDVEMKKLYFVLAVMAVLVSVGYAADVNLAGVMVNPGFEQYTGTPPWADPQKITGFDMEQGAIFTWSTNPADVTGWDSTGPMVDCGVQGWNYGYNSNFGVFLMGSDGYISQTTSAAITAGDTYSLSLALKHAGTWPSAEGIFAIGEVSLYAFDGTTKTILTTLNTGLLNSDGAYHVFNISYAADGTYAGQFIGVQIDNVAEHVNTWMAVDVPEPATLSLLGLGVAALLRRRK
jgi:hypothetical protein